MKQIGGKSIWTLPFKRKYTGSTANGGKPQLAVTGRINISSIIKYIKSLRKHKTRRILFAEVESNEFVHQNSYNVLSSQLRAGGRAGVIDFEKQCGILIYMVSSYFLTPAHSLSHHLKKYFDGHKARAPTTKIFGIIVLKMEVYNQVKRKASKSYMLTQKYPKPPKPAAPPTPNERPPLPPNAPPPNGSGSISGPPGKPRPPQPPPPPGPPSGSAPPPPPNGEGDEVMIKNEEQQQKEVDDVWMKLENEIEDDLGDLPPPLPAHFRRFTTATFHGFK